MLRIRRVLAMFNYEEKAKREHKVMADLQRLVQRHIGQDVVLVASLQEKFKQANNRNLCCDEISYENEDDLFLFELTLLD
uniref:Uncharacterized protein n=1 Tax=Salix viminalis TaxID=40686 RepID=A0A6N2KM83_SALVM